MDLKLIYEIAEIAVTVVGAGTILTACGLFMAKVSKAVSNDIPHIHEEVCKQTDILVEIKDALKK
jgi:hypothetical protein